MVHAYDGYNGLFTLFTFLFFTLTFLRLVNGGTFCFSGSGFDREVEYCEYGCCGEDCCPFTITTGVIIGVVIGGLVFLGVLIACIACLCCLCQNSKRSPSTGRTIQPLNTTSASAPNPNYGHPPPSYSQFNSHPNVFDRYPPPNYNQIYSNQVQPPIYNDPAYPPGMTSTGV